MSRTQNKESMNGAGTKSYGSVGNAQAHLRWGNFHSLTQALKPDSSWSQALGSPPGCQAGPNLDFFSLNRVDLRFLNCKWREQQESPHKTEERLKK